MAERDAEVSTEALFPRTTGPDATHAAERDALQALAVHAAKGLASCACGEINDRGTLKKLRSALPRGLPRFVWKPSLTSRTLIGGDMMKRASRVAP